MFNDCQCKREQKATMTVDTRKTKGPVRTSFDFPDSIEFIKVETVLTGRCKVCGGEYTATFPLKSIEE